MEKRKMSIKEAERLSIMQQIDKKVGHINAIRGKVFSGEITAFKNCIGLRLSPESSAFRQPR